MKTYTCIVCPLSCEVTVTETDGGPEFAGNGCARGRAFASDEHSCPKRMLTATVRITGAAHRRLPVISSGEIEKALLRQCLRELYGTSVSAPVKMGDVIVKNILGTGADILAARDIVE